VHKSNTQRKQNATPAYLKEEGTGELNLLKRKQGGVNKGGGKQGRKRGQWGHNPENKSFEETAVAGEGEIGGSIF